MRATPEWMAEKYNEMNNWLFDGELGPCNFALFTTGKGSEGKTLGKFSMNNRYLRVDKRRRRLIMWYGSWGNSEYVDTEMFKTQCNPTISLNGHYSGTEESLLDTLVHEMVHYANYMYGYCPAKPHGREFKEMASLISSRSDGRFSVQRLASAETMQGYQLDGDMQKKRDTREQNRLSKVNAVFVYMNDGKINFTQTASKALVDEIVRYWDTVSKNPSSRQAVRILYSNDPQMIDFLTKNGYRKMMRTHRYWEIQDKPMSAFIEEYPCELIWKNPNITENKKPGISTIIESVVKEYVDQIESGEDLIPISGMNLGIMSPLEEK